LLEIILIRFCRHVQDLEKQLAQAKSQNDKLRSMLHPGEEMEDVHRPSTGAPLGLGHSLQPSPMFDQSTQRPSRYDQARKNIRLYSRGIFKPPPAYRKTKSYTDAPKDMPRLPPKHIADQLIAVCHDTFCQYSPVLHWPTFLDEYEALYKTGSLLNASRPWAALLFAMLAIGALPRQGHASLATLDANSDGDLYLQEALGQMQGWNDDLTIDHCRAALLISVYYVESNMRSAGWTWLTLAVSFGTEIGLQDETRVNFSIKTETRRRVWWAIYLWER